MIVLHPPKVVIGNPNLKLPESLFQGLLEMSEEGIGFQCIFDIHDHADEKVFIFHALLNPETTHGLRVESRSLKLSDELNAGLLELLGFDRRAVIIPEWQQNLVTP